MDSPRILLSLVFLSLSGCSSIGDGWDNATDFVFGPDDGGSKRQEKAAVIISDAANSVSPEKAVVKKVVQDNTDKLFTAAANVIDNTFKNSKTVATATQITSKKLRVSLINVKGFEPDLKANGNSLNFMQSSATYANSRFIGNVGLGRRYLSEDETFIFGVNSFLDIDPVYGHLRMSVGTELKSSAFELNVNKYKALSQWNKGKNNNQERPVDGQDIEIGAQIPYIPSAKFYLKDWKWEGVEGNADTKGKTYSLAFSQQVNGINIELGRRNYDGLTKDESFGKITYSVAVGDAPSQPEQTLVSSKMFEGSSMKDRMLDKVRRNNSIVIQTKFAAGIGGV